MLNPEARLHSEARQLVTEMEERTGGPVRIEEVAGLQVLSNVTGGTEAGGAGLVVRVREGSSFLDYLVAFQAVKLLRAWSLPESERRRFVPAAPAIPWARGLLETHLKERRTKVQRQALQAMAEALVDGLAAQLRAIPGGMRVDEELASRCPSLAPQQAAALAVEAKEALSSLDPDARTAVPDDVVAASVILNCVRALFDDRLLKSDHAKPYAEEGFRELGEAFLALYDAAPKGPAGDASVIDAWAAHLGMSERFRWLPVEPGRSYLDLTG